MQTNLLWASQINEYLKKINEKLASLIKEFERKVQDGNYNCNIFDDCWGMVNGLPFRDDRCYRDDARVEE